MIYFSCIITCYNREKSIGRSINSILNQSHQHFEILIVDDCSDDNSIEAILSFDDPRIKLIKHEVNLGQNPSLNTGVNNSKFDYLAFLDSDDEWEKDYLLHMSNVYENSPLVGFVYSNVVEGPLWTLEGESKYAEVLNKGHLSSMISITAKKFAVLNVGGFDPKYKICQDDDFCFRLSKYYSFKVIQQQLARIHDDQNSMTKDHVRVIKGWEFLFRNYKADIEKFCGSKTFSKHILHVSQQYFHHNQIFKGIYCYFTALYHFFKPSKNKFAFTLKEFSISSSTIPKTIIFKVIRKLSLK